MDIKFEFRHDNLSMVDLHRKGIRNTKWLEEVILGDSFWDKYEIDGELVYYATGFTFETVGLVVVFTFDENMNIVTEEVKRASVDEIKKDFCKFCKF